MVVHLGGLQAEHEVVWFVLVTAARAKTKIASKLARRSEPDQK
jgi:hypothetical protein